MSKPQAPELASSESHNPSAVDFENFNFRKSRFQKSKLSQLILGLSLAVGSAGTFAEEDLAEEDLAEADQQVSQPLTNEDGSANEELEEVIVTATRRSMQNALAKKKDSDLVVDVLSAGDIGDIPSLSVAEALEGIPGASTHRLKGSGSQVSIRGLGPFLGFSTFNGRSVTTGSADRSVNFQQFPAELIDTITIYKTQRADLVEGATSGTVNLESLRPLDYGKQAFTFDVRGKYNSHAARVDGNDGIGNRGSINLIDQFDTEFGKVGVAIGYARFDSGNPEESYLTSSTFQLCDASQDPGSSRCSGYDQQDQADDLAAGINSARPYFAPSSITYRTQDEVEKRDAIISTFQWQPNDQLNVNFDMEFSEKFYEEDRHDMIIDDARRAHSNVISSPSYALDSYSGESRTKASGELYRRDEDYKGGGINIEWMANDKLFLEADYSVANTQRDRIRRVATFRSDYVTYDYLADGLVPSVILDPAFDATDLTQFSRSNDAELRNRATNRSDDIWAFRLDGTYSVDNGFVSNIKSGVRYSEHQRITNNEDTNRMRLGDINDEYWNGEADLDELLALGFACEDSNFPNENFFGSKDGGSNIGGQFATFDTECVTKAWTQGLDRVPEKEDRRGTNDIDVTESVTAAYVMAEFDSEIASFPVSGNFGVRVVKTDVDSIGLRSDYEVVENVTDPANPTYSVDTTGEFSTVKFTNSITEVLPSVNANFELDDDLIFRGSAYRSMSRDNIEKLGAGRKFGSIDSDIEYNSPEEALREELSSASGGNPDLKPLMAWNLDFSLERYFSEDTAASIALYYKQFEAKTFPQIVTETINVNGVDLLVDTQKEVNIDENSDLWGMELVGQHVFTNLPTPFNGIGVKATYNYADTNFETQDPVLGAEIQDDGSLLPGMSELEPANIFGMSNHVGSFTGFWDIGGFNMQAIVKYRSAYFQPNAGSPKSNRWIDEFTYLDLSASYKLTKSLKMRATVQNLLDEPQSGQRGARSGSTTLWSSTGPKWEIGISGSF